MKTILINVKRILALALFFFYLPFVSAGGLYTKVMLKIESGVEDQSILIIKSGKLYYSNPNQVPIGNGYEQMSGIRLHNVQLSPPTANGQFYSMTKCNGGNDVFAVGNAGQVYHMMKGLGPDGEAREAKPGFWEKINIPGLEEGSNHLLDVACFSHDGSTHVAIVGFGLLKASKMKPILFLGNKTGDANYTWTNRSTLFPNHNSLAINHVAAGNNGFLVAAIEANTATMKVTSHLYTFDSKSLIKTYPVSDIIYALVFAGTKADGNDIFAAITDTQIYTNYVNPQNFIPGYNFSGKYILPPLTSVHPNDLIHPKNQRAAACIKSSVKDLVLCIVGSIVKYDGAQQTLAYTWFEVGKNFIFPPFNIIENSDDDSMFDMAVLANELSDSIEMYYSFGESNEIGYRVFRYGGISFLKWLKDIKFGH